MINLKKAGVIAGLAGLLFAGSIASAEFIDLGSFTANRGKAKNLALPGVRAEVVSGMLPGEKSDIKLHVTNPNSIPAWISFRADSVDVVTGPESCAGEIVIAGGGTDAWGAKAEYAAHESGTVTLSQWVQLKSDAPDSCEGFTFQVHDTSHISAGDYRP